QPGKDLIKYGNGRLDATLLRSRLRIVDAASKPRRALSWPSWILEGCGAWRRRRPRFAPPRARVGYALALLPITGRHIGAAAARRPLPANDESPRKDASRPPRCTCPWPRRWTRLGAPESRVPD